MNIKIDPLTFEAWDEMYFIITNLDDVEGCRHLKAKGLTTKYKSKINITICFLLALILIFILALIKSRHPEIHIVVGSFLLTCTIYVLLYNFSIYRTIKKDINRRINTEYKTTSLKINKDGVTFIKNRKGIITMPWNSIYMILVNKETITFLPEESNEVSITIPVKYKTRLLTKLKKEKKEALFLDNSYLYDDSNKINILDRIKRCYKEHIKPKVKK